MAEDPSGAAARIDRAIDDVHASIKDIRNFILGLRPHLLERTDLVGGLAALANELRLNTMVDVEVDLDEGVEAAGGLSDGRRAQLLQIAREALSNAARHAGASRATLRLAHQEGGLFLRVEDNGRGFDPGAVPGGEHQGLVNMRDRAASVGGQLEVDSSPGKGTRIIVRIPITTGAPGT
jgi:two-component system sensor histidine kinase DegS